MRSTVSIEPIALKHADAVQHLASNPALAETSNLPSPYPPGGAEAWIRRSIAHRQSGIEYAFAVVARGAVVGACALVDVLRDDRTGARAELGYWIGKDFWGRGFATAAAGAVTDFGFSTLLLDRIQSSCLVRNPASRRVLEKVGFQFLGLGTNPDPKWTAEDQFAMFELTRTDWRHHKRS